jgi:hypothetical protein
VTAAADFEAGLAAGEAGQPWTPRPIADVDVPQSVVEADARLQELLADPPLGHTPVQQPRDWYERVFDLLACAHPETCACTPEEAS